MNCRITLLKGDGIGPEVIDGATAVLNAVERKFGHDFGLSSMPFGGNALDLTGVPLPEETLNACKRSDAVLVGAVGGPQWNDIKPHNRPERALISLRSALGLYAGLYPAVLYPALAPSSALRADVAKRGADILLVRELSGGIYNGEHGYRDGALGQEAYDTDVYSISAVERIADMAFELARTRKRRVASVDKANVLTASKLWRATVDRVAKGYPDVEIVHKHVGNCAIELLTRPDEFDVILTSGLFGDMLVSELAAITGSIGMLPSCVVGKGAIGIYGAVHGSAPDIAGKDTANPIGAILSAAMLLASSLGLRTEAAAIDKAVKTTLAKGLRTKDIAHGKKYVTCSRMAEEIAINVFNA